jgi:LysR family transcriptional regulator for bpeEF and oprC
MDRFQAMQVFIAVVDANSFTRAADHLNLPRATVTTIVQGLESLLQVRLLNRTTRRISLTPDGAAYYERCVRILADVCCCCPICAISIANTRTSNWSWA